MNTTIPPPQVSMFDARSGTMSREWYRFFSTVFNRVGGETHDVARGIAVGGLYFSSVAGNPRVLLGYGTWVTVGTGKMIVGIDPDDPDFATLGLTGGSKTASISAHTGTAVADHDDHTHDAGTLIFTGNAVAAASTQGTPDLVAPDTSGTGVSPVTTATGTISGDTGGASITLTHDVTQPDNHSDITILPPYLVCHIWKRTA